MARRRLRREPRLRPAALHRRLRRPRALPDQVQRLDLHRARAPAQPGDADYRRWGPGYWWQNTRLPYLSMCASGDFELMQPLFRMYAGEVLMPLARTAPGATSATAAPSSRSASTSGATSSARPTAGRPSRSAARTSSRRAAGTSGNGSSGPELVWMMLDYYDHTLDAAFLRETLLPDRARDPDLLRPALRRRRRGQARHAPLPGAGDLVGLHQPDARGRRPARGDRAPARPAGRARPAPSSARSGARLRAKLPDLPTREVDGRARCSLRPSASRRSATSRTRSSTRSSPSASSPSRRPNADLGSARPRAPLGPRQLRLAPGRHLHGLPRPRRARPARTS